MSLHFGPGKATFIHIPKCAGTSVKQWGRSLPGTRSVAKHIKSNQALTIFRNPGQIFAVIRNPYDRAVSLFHFCGQLGTGQITMQQRWPACYYVWRDLYGLGFESFLAALRDHDAAADTNDPNWHLWDCQWSWVADAPDPVLLRYENLSQDFEKIQVLLEHHDPLPLVNRSKHQDYRVYLNSNVQKLIEDIWSEDIQRFDYRP